jgi:ParB-like chromosome segregation protein Spo0J
VIEHPIERLHIDQIRLDPRNVFLHSEEELRRLAGVMAEHGNLSVVCVDVATREDRDLLIDGETRRLPTYELVGGEARLAAYRAVGVAIIPAIMASFASDAQRRAAAIALNGHFGRFDDAALDEMLRELAEADYSLTLTGLEPYRYADVLADTAPSLDDLAAKYGEVNDADFWPEISLKVPPEIKEHYDGLLPRMEGEGTHEKFAQLLEYAEQGILAPTA